MASLVLKISMLMALIAFQFGDASRMSQQLQHSEKQDPEDGEELDTSAGEDVEEDTAVEDETTDVEEDTAVEDETTDVEEDTTVEELAPAVPMPKPEGIMGYLKMTELYAGSFWFQWAKAKPDDAVAMITPAKPIKGWQLTSKLEIQKHTKEPRFLTSGTITFLRHAHRYGTDFTFLASDLGVKILILDSSMKVSTVKPLETISTADLKAAIVTPASSGEFNNEFSVNNVPMFTDMALGKSHTLSIVF